MADAALRREQTGRPAPARLARAGRLAPVVLRAAGLRHARLRLHRDGRGGGRGQPDQPALRDLLRAAVGRLRPASRSCSGRPTRRSARCAPSTRRSPGSPAATPTTACSPTPSGSATGRRRSVSTRSCGWSWSTRSRPSSDRCGCGCAVVRRRDAARRRAVRQPVLRARRPVRGLLDAGRPDVGVGPARRSSWWSAARWPTWRPRRSRPGLVAVTAVLFGSTAFDSFKDSTRWVKFIQGDFVPGTTGVTRCSPTSACSPSCSRWR